MLNPPLSNQNGQLYIDQVNTSSLVRKFGSPLYVYSAQRIRENYTRLLNNFHQFYPETEVFYCLKSNFNPALVSLMRQLGAGADCSCPEEIKIAHNCDIPSPKIIYTGNYCRDEELQLALQQKLIINLDDETLLPRLLKFGQPEILSFRINPGIGAGNVKSNVFGGKEAKFGIPIEQALTAYRAAVKAGIRRFGIHMMTGSCILDATYFPNVTRKLANLTREISRQLKIEFEFIDIGGGFGIPYKPTEKPLDIKTVARRVAQILKTTFPDVNHRPTLFLEPGRYLMGDAGILLTQIHTLKQSYQNFAGIDAGSHLLIRPKIYNAYHHILVANRLGARHTQKINVCGPLCDNGDILAHHRPLPKLRVNDLLAILDVGAYGYSMSSNYNTRSRCPEILIDGRKTYLIREKETLTDLIRHTTIPPHLKPKKPILNS